jgi:hypothetical protein
MEPRMIGITQAAARVENPRHGQAVRKRLEDDCLLEGQLHPSIAERLQRVRELPVAGAGNLIGVERDESGAWLVWQHVEGANLEEFLAGTRSAAERELVSQQLRHVVAAMHAHGIVHGAIHARNVIIDPAGRARLIHMSPYLHADPTEDDRAVEGLVARLIPAPASAPSTTPASPDSAERRLRHRAFLGAAITLLVALLSFAGILWYIRGA